MTTTHPIVSVGGLIFCSPRPQIEYDRNRLFIKQIGQEHFITITGRVKSKDQFVKDARIKSATNPGIDIVGRPILCPGQHWAFVFKVDNADQDYDLTLRSELRRVGLKFPLTSTVSFTISAKMRLR